MLYEREILLRGAVIHVFFLRARQSAIDVELRAGQIAPTGAR
jgi:hypothetical protein